MLSGGFKRSGLFGLVGVVVVAIAIAAIALNSEGEANPKGTMALIFGLIAAFVIVLFVFQRSDLTRAARGDSKAVQRALAEGGGKVDNPTTMEEATLWAALAVKPIDDAAVEARSAMWEPVRRGQRLAWVVMGLVFLTVPAIYLTESFVPLLIGGPLIAIAAIFGSVRALAPGGDVDSAYEKVGVAMAPLGLELTERPKVNIEVREATSGRVGPRVHGELVLSGERHGRQVTARLGSNESEVRVSEPCNRFSVGSRKLTVESGPEGIVVRRKGGAQADWLCDLWLAEHLADAAGN